MKVAVSILLFSFTLILFTPLAFMRIPSPQLSCETECCEEEEATDNEDPGCCPLEMCNPSQCVFCCFLCPVTGDKIVVRVFDSAAAAISAEGDLLLSGFATDCWQPPELT